jgi:hypothetical protein
VIGRLTAASHQPAGVRRIVPWSGSAYQLGAPNAMVLLQSHCPSVATRTISPTSIGIELRSRIAEAISPSNRGTSAVLTMPRSRNCATIARVRPCTTSSAAMRMGSATRKRVCDSMSRRKGRVPGGPTARPPAADSISNGTQATTVMTQIRRQSCSSAGPLRCARRKSW